MYNICYVEDELGGFFCYENDLDHSEYKVCCKGTKEEVEEYIGYKIDNHIK